MEHQAKLDAFQLCIRPDLQKTVRWRIWTKVISVCGDVLFCFVFNPWIYTCFICVVLSVGEAVRIGASQRPTVSDRLKKDSWQTTNVYVDSSPTFSTLVSVLWAIRTRAINHHKQHTWTAVALYSANKRGSTQSAEGMSVLNLNQPCYKTGVWRMLYNDLQPPWATYCDSQWDSCLCKGSECTMHLCTICIACRPEDFFCP